MGLHWDPDKPHRWGKIKFIKATDSNCCQQNEICHWKATSMEELEKSCPKCGQEMMWQKEIVGRDRLGDVEKWVGRCPKAFI